MSSWSLGVFYEDSCFETKNRCGLSEGPLGIKMYVIRVFFSKFKSK